MAGSIRICLIAEGFVEDLKKCVSSIQSFTKTPVSIHANGKSNWFEQNLFDPNQVSISQDKNPLGWGNLINQFLNQHTEDYLLIMEELTQVLSTIEMQILSYRWR